MSRELENRIMGLLYENVEQSFSYPMNLDVKNMLEISKEEISTIIKQALIEKDKLQSKLDKIEEEIDKWVLGERGCSMLDDVRVIKNIKSIMESE